MPRQLVFVAIVMFAISLQAVSTKEINQCYSLASKDKVRYETCDDLEIRYIYEQKLTKSKIHKCKDGNEYETYCDEKWCYLIRTKYKGLNERTTVELSRHMFIGTLSESTSKQICSDFDEKNFNWSAYR